MTPGPLAHHDARGRLGARVLRCLTRSSASRARPAKPPAEQKSHRPTSRRPGGKPSKAKPAGEAALDAAHLSEDQKKAVQLALSGLPFVMGRDQADHHRRRLLSHRPATARTAICANATAATWPASSSGAFRAQRAC